MLVLDDQPATQFGRLFAPLLPQWQPKDALSRTTRSVDFARVLHGRQIASVAYAAQGVTVGSAVVTGSCVTLLLTGGVPGRQPARIELRAICSDGTDEPAAVALPIVSLLTLTGGDSVSATQTITTNGTVAGVLGPLPIYAASGASVGIRGTVLARNLATGDTASWDVAVTVKGFGGSGAVIAEQSITAFELDPALAGCALSVSVNAGAVMFAVTGIAGAAVIWSYNLDWAVA